MAFYLLTGQYRPEALRGMVEQAEDRTEASGALIGAFGGSIDRYFMTLDGAAFVLIAEFPDNACAMSCAAVVVSSGTVSDFEVTPLMPMTGMQAVFRAARDATAGYRPAGR